MDTEPQWLVLQDQSYDPIQRGQHQSTQEPAQAPALIQGVAQDLPPEPVMTASCRGASGPVKETKIIYGTNLVWFNLELRMKPSGLDSCSDLFSETWVQRKPKGFWFGVHPDLKPKVSTATNVRYRLVSDLKPWRLSSDFSRVPF